VEADGVIVVGGPAANGIDASLAKLLDAKLVQAKLKIFPDSESLVKVSTEVEQEDVILVQSTYEPQDRNLMQLLFLADLIDDLGASSITAVVPYLAYIRQDKRFTEGEAISIKTVLNLMNAVGIGSLITVQPHKKYPLDYFKGKATAIYPIEQMIKSAAPDFTDPFILSPDKGSVEFAEKAAEVIGCDYTFIEKERSRETGEVRITHATDKSFTGKQVIIVDDMISSGGTIVLAANYAYENGATEVVAAAPHLLMNSGAYGKMRAARVNRIYGTNTIPFENAKLTDISMQIADAIKKEMITSEA
jgi:ribose-phosphate pyrophosphokinase